MTMRPTRTIPGLLLIAAAFTGCSKTPEPEEVPTAAAPGGAYTTWETYAGAADASQYSALDQINQSNVSRLAVAWTFPVGDRSFVFNPIVVGNTIYVLARNNEIVALNAATGAELWSYESPTGVSERGNA